MTAQFLRQKCAAQRLKNVQRCVMAPDREVALIFPFVDSLGDGAHHPHHAQQVISVGMGQKQMVQVGKGQLGIGQLTQNAVAAAGIHQQKFFCFAQGEAGIIALGHHGVAGA